MNINSNFFWCIIGIIGGAFLSFIISLIFYFIGLKRKKLIYNIKTYCVISEKVNQINGLIITYNSSEIDNLFFSTISIKNIGNSIIEKQDFASLHPLSICTNGMFLVDQSNETNLFSYNKENSTYPLFNDNEFEECNKITISIDYISKKEELTCSLFHTGDISINGILKEGKIYNSNEHKKIGKLYTILNNLLDTQEGTIIFFICCIILGFIGSFIFSDIYFWFKK